MNKTFTFIETQFSALPLDFARIFFSDSHGFCVWIFNLLIDVDHRHFTYVMVSVHFRKHRWLAGWCKYVNVFVWHKCKNVICRFNTSVQHLFFICLSSCSFRFEWNAARKPDTNQHRSIYKHTKARIDATNSSSNNSTHLWITVHINVGLTNAWGISFCNASHGTRICFCFALFKLHGMNMYIYV